MRKPDNIPTLAALFSNVTFSMSVSILEKLDTDQVPDTGFLSGNRISAVRRHNSRFGQGSDEGAT
jgi:hypothetical protein